MDSLGFTGLFKALRLYEHNQIEAAMEVCTELLAKNPLDQAAWSLKLACLTESAYIDELENEDIGIAEAFMDQNVIATSARPGTSFQRPNTTAKGSNPILRPTTNSGRPLSGVARPMSALRPGTMEQAVRTARTAKTARAVSSQSARMIRLGTASMASSADGPFVNLARLNIEKYGADPLVNRQLFEYVFYVEADIKIAHQIAAVATKAAEYNDWYWKSQLGKCYLRMGLYAEAEKQFLSSLGNAKLIETFAYLSKVACRLDQPTVALKYYDQGLQQYPNDVTLLTGLARVREQLGDLEESINIYKQLVRVESNNIEALACIATTHFYSDKPEIALLLYRRILVLGVSSAELFMNIGMCCYACQQFDFAISSMQRGLFLAGDIVAADIWYNLGNIMMSMGDFKYADRCFRLALEADNGHGEALVNLGVLKETIGKKEQAKSLYHSAVSKAPHLFEAHFNLGLLYFKMGEYESSKVFVDGALLIFPNHTHSLKLHQKLTDLYNNI